MPISPVPAQYFAMVLGTEAMGLTLRGGAMADILPVWPGEATLLASACLWLLFLLRYCRKWIALPEAAKAELHHPIQGCFVSLVPITTTLMGVAVLPYSLAAAWILAGTGITGQLLFGAWRAAGLWRGLQMPEATTTVLYLPTIATGFVSAMAMGALGLPLWGYLFLGAGFFSWLSLESVVLLRFRTVKAVPPPLRPAMGIQLAPAFVGCSAYFALNGGAVDTPALCLIGYGLLQTLYLARLFPWIAEGGFTPGFWAFSFGLASMAGCGLRLTAFALAESHSDMLFLGWAMFGTGTVLVLLLAVLTIRFFIKKSAAPASPQKA